MGERVIEYTVSQGEARGRADKFFSAKFDDVSRVRLQKAFDAGKVTFEGEVIDRRFKLKSAGVLRAVLEEILVVEGPKPVELPLNIVYEDESLIVVNKAPGMIVHPGSGTGDDTLVHALLHHCEGALSSVGAPERPGIVHRLDKETSGLILVAKTDRAHHRLAKAFSERETYKRYRTLVLGTPKKMQGSCLDPIGRHSVNRTKMAITGAGREAHTDWTLEDRFAGKTSLISCVIHTGRTHQIRVHMSAMNLPILGDITYGFRANRLKGFSVPRVMLHATELRIPHPDRNEIISFDAPLPEDFRTLINQLKEV